MENDNKNQEIDDQVARFKKQVAESASSLNEHLRPHRLKLMHRSELKQLTDQNDDPESRFCQLETVLGAVGQDSWDNDSRSKLESRSRNNTTREQNEEVGSQSKLMEATTITKERATMFVGIVFGFDPETGGSTLVRWYFDKVRENVEEACEWRAELETPRGCGDYWGYYQMWEIPESLAYWLIGIFCENRTQAPEEFDPSNFNAEPEMDPSDLIVEPEMDAFDFNVDPEMDPADRDPLDGLNCTP